MSTWLTYREAGRLVKRSPRTIRYWRQRGMPMEWQERDGQHVRVVEKTVLQAWFRERLANWPTHQYRQRRRRLEREEIRLAQESEQETTRREDS